MDLVYITLRETQTFQEIFSLILVVFAECLTRSLALYLRGLQFLLVFRFSINWFPNINPYIQPVYGLCRIVESYVSLFKNLLPIIFGIDCSPMLTYMGLQLIINELDRLQEYLKNYF